ncbi:disulfide bond formation protein DsbD [Solibacillus cecembensis]|uniref:disulfide bond formation protein DsbD n=1 Tax=Solibacillus cecembensis TaxID=459347 RepID=UPI003D04A486
MNKRVFNIIGWIFLLGMVASWIRLGYLDLYLILLPVATICFSIKDDSIKKIKKMSILQVIVILFAFIASVGIVFGLIQLANHFINDRLHLTGWMK